MTKAQPFPLGCAVKDGYCDGVYCISRGDSQLVASARVGPEQDMDLCADCLADFAGGARQIPTVHVYAVALDGVYHELTRDGTELLEAEP